GMVHVKIFSLQHSLFTAIHKHYTVEAWKEFAAENPGVLCRVAASSGNAPGDFEKLSSILKEIPNVQFICLDVANGYSEHFVELVRKVRKAYPDLTIMAGNVVTGEMVEELILSGADLVKVGIGPGSVCTTRKKTGVGYPQLSAVIECGDAAHGLGGHIISDGGCTCPGDVAKAFGAGADFVMLGGMLAGHDQSGGDTIIKNGIKMKQFYGMASNTAMMKHQGSVAEYRASEGKTVEIPYRGDVENTILDVLGGLRSACTYTGAAKLKELPKRTTFIRVTQQLNEDGGCTCPGDVAKAFGAGADFVMLGGMLAGHDQSGGDTIIKNGIKMKQFYGMASNTAMLKHQGSVAEYRASEGKTVEIPYRGDVENTILDVLGGLRSACTYTGAAKLKELSKRTTFIRVTQQLNEVFRSSDG
ncbi:unnamed protein product, partial [Darwinula stevensoni]